MASRSLKSKILAFLLECVSLATPAGRLAAFSIGIAVLVLLVPRAGSFPDICLFDRFFGYCPACGTTRALSCFFRGEFAEAVKFNRNVFLTGPVIVFMFIKDMIAVFKERIV